MAIEPELKPRKRPTQSRAQATCAAIVEAAARILEESGFEAFTTNAIAARAGVSIGSFYQYFPGKEAVAAALIARETERLVADLREAAQAPDWRAGLRLAIGAAAAHQLSRPALARRLEQAEDQLQLTQGAASVATAARAALVPLLEQMRPSLDDPEEAAHDLIALVRGLVDAAGMREETDLDGLARRMEWAVFGYLSQRARAGRKRE